MKSNSSPKKFAYRIHPVPVQSEGTIRCGYCIQVKDKGSKAWSRLVAVGKKPLLYFNKATAERHCAYLNEPTGTEPQWGVDDPPAGDSSFRSKANLESVGSRVHSGKYS